jgi:hypothetical protein
MPECRVLLSRENFDAQGKQKLSGVAAELSVLTGLRSSVTPCPPFGPRAKAARMLDGLHCCNTVSPAHSVCQALEAEGATGYPSDGESAS